MTEKKSIIKKAITAETIADVATGYYLLLRIIRLSKKRRRDPELRIKTLERRAYSIDRILYEFLKRFNVEVNPNLSGVETFSGDLGETGATFTTIVSFDTVEEVCSKLREIDRTNGGQLEQRFLENGSEDWLGRCMPLFGENSINNMINIRKDMVISDIRRNLVCVLVHELVHQTDLIEIYIKDDLKQKIKVTDLANLLNYMIKSCLTNLCGMKNQE